MWLMYSGVHIASNRLVMITNDMLANRSYHHRLERFICAQQDTLISDEYSRDTMNYGVEVCVKSMWRPIQPFRIKIQKNSILINSFYVRKILASDVANLLEYSFYLAQQRQYGKTESFKLQKVHRVFKFFGGIGAEMVTGL